MHEVKPVTKGTRVTVTYLIETKEDNANDKTAGCTGSSKGFFCGPVDATMNTSKVDELLDNLKGMRRRGRVGRARDHPYHLFFNSLLELPAQFVKIGMFLSHKYTSTAIDMETLKVYSLPSCFRYSFSSSSIVF